MLKFLLQLRLNLFSEVTFLDLNKGPKIFPMRFPKLDASLYPIILKIENNKIITKNSKKYLKFLINV